MQSQGMKMGDDYAQALGAGLRKSTSTPQIVNLSINRLSDTGAVPILNQLTKDLKELDLSQNPKLQTKTYQIIKEITSGEYTNLLTLKLDSNNIGNESCAIICQGISKNSILAHLSLSHNKIGDMGAIALAKMISTNNCMNVLYIGWNKIRYKGGQYIADALAQNNSIKIFDASFNAFGSGFQYKAINQLNNTPQQTSRQKQTSSLNQTPDRIKLIVNEDQLFTAQSFKQMFINNKTLVHIDLSHNGFMEQELQIINEGLKLNHTVLGLHMIGNQKILDPQGFITQDDQRPSASHIMTRLQPQLNYGSIKKRIQELNLSQNCWLCEGWSQVMFQFNPLTSLHKQLDEYTPIYIHLSCDDYKPDLMERNEDGVYRLLRMLPPSQLNYYYTIGSETENYAYGNDQRHREYTQLEKIDNKQLKVPIANFVDNVINKKPQIIDTTLEEMQELIRHPPRDPNSQDKIKEPWDLKKSVFAKYIPDNDQLLKQCFEFDMEISKIAKFVKDPDEFQKLKTYLESIYQHIRECYKYFAAISTNNSVFSIGQLIFQEIINNTSILDRDLLTTSEVDLEYITTNAVTAKFKNNPDRSLVRHQFMEILVRLAIQKYYKSRICNSQTKAVKKMFEEELLPYLKSFNCHEWRKAKLWTETCDVVFKAYMPVLKMLYNQNSGKWTKPGCQVFMSLDEFQQLIVNTDICTENFGTREIGIHYNLSMMTQVNELENDKHMQMQFIEFLEGIGRIAEKLNLESLRERFGMEEEEEDKKYIADSDCKLSTKIEFLIRLLMDNNLNIAGNNRKYKQVNKLIDSNISKTKTLQEEARKTPAQLFKKVSMMTMMINRFRTKLDQGTGHGKIPTPTVSNLNVTQNLQQQQQQDTTPFQLDQSNNNSSISKTQINNITPKSTSITPQSSILQRLKSKLLKPKVNFLSPMIDEKDIDNDLKEADSQIDEFNE